MTLGNTLWLPNLEIVTWFNLKKTYRIPLPCDINSPYCCDKQMAIDSHHRSKAASSACPCLAQTLLNIQIVPPMIGNKSEIGMPNSEMYSICTANRIKF